jgi:DtxR family Mn-dependent transcriptional regulator
VPTSTVEDYLKCILLRQGATEELVGMGHVAAALQVTPGTVTSMVKALADSGLVSYEPYSGVRLTPAGRQLAARVVRRHRLVELFLVEIMGLNWSEVHAEAERLEHAVSDHLIERMDEMLGHPATDPHGDPIPSAHGVLAADELRDLAAYEPGSEVVVARIADQSSEFLRLVESEGLMPGSRVRVEAREAAADRLRLRLGAGGSVDLGLRAASKIYVRPA